MARKRKWRYVKGQITDRQLEVWRACNFPDSADRRVLRPVEVARLYGISRQRVSEICQGVKKLLKSQAIDPQALIGAIRSLTP